jgi:hypothetical protein
LTVSSGGDPAASPLQLDRNGLVDPDQIWRKTYAPDSQDVHGSELISAVLSQSSLPLIIWVNGSDYATFRTNRKTLIDTLSQFTYTATVTIDSQVEVWQCDPADISPGPVLVEQVAAHHQNLTLTIPVYPIPGSV